MNNNNNKKDKNYKHDVIEKLYQEKISTLKQKAEDDGDKKEFYTQEYEEIRQHIKEMRELDIKREVKANSMITIIGGIVLVVFIVIAIGSIKYTIDKNKSNKSIANNRISTVKADDDTKENSSNTKKEDTSTAKKTVDTKSVDIKNDDFGQKLYNYLKVEDNRQKMYDVSFSENNNKNKGMNLILLRSILNENGLKLPHLGNNASLKRELTKAGFKQYTNPSELKEGDVVFTTEVKGVEGVPSHVYIFMGWADKNHVVGYVVDGQVSIYHSTYHKRTITKHTTVTEKMQFFMRK